MQPDAYLSRRDFRALACGYIDAAQWATPDRSTIDAPLPRMMDDAELGAGMRSALAFHVCRWARRHADMVARAAELRGGFEFVGHDAWLSQEGHGTGFWDRPELDADGLGKALDAAAQELPSPSDHYIDEDGLAYFEFCLRY